ncbi:hypothetical protein ACVDG8_026555 [Mesorhizobium sp. ORM8.1]
MVLNFEDIAGHPALHACVRAQALALLQALEANPRASAVFATQQRWLMAHIGLALHFRRDPGDYRKEMTAARFVDVTVQHRVATRNTAHAFIKEMEHYNFIEVGPSGDDARIRPLLLTAATLEALTGWVYVHLGTLGSVGWLGQRGHSVMWISNEFYGEYVAAQAVKLAIIDAAFGGCLA